MEVLHAQAWLQEELKLTEPPPATEKKTENTTSGTTSSTLPKNELTVPDIVPATSEQGTGNVPTVVPTQSKQDKVELIIPENVPKISPVMAINDLIRRGYRDRDNLEALMKANFNGKAYRKDIMEQLALFEARQPPFNDIPLPQDTTASTTAGTTSPTTSDTTSSTLPNAQNTPVLPPSGIVPGNVPGNVPKVVPTVVPAVSEQPTDLPDVLKAARSLTDEQAISNCPIAYHYPHMVVSKQASFRKRFETF